MACNNTSSVSLSFHPVMQQPLWITSMALSIIVIAFHSWIAVRFFQYAWDEVHRTSSRCYGGPGRRVLRCGLAVVVVPYIRYADTQATLWVSAKLNNDTACNQVRISSMIAYVICILTVFIFLWLRQRVFYSHPLLTQALGRRSNLISWGILIMNVAAAFGESLYILVKAFVGKNDFLKSSPTGCVVRNQCVALYFHPFFYGSTFIILQSILLGLFLYPLCHHYKSQKRFQERWTKDEESAILVEETACGSATLSSKDSPRRPEKKQEGKVFLKSEGAVENSCHKMLNQLIWKTSFFTAVCMLSDFAAMIIDGTALPMDIPQGTVYLMYDVSLLLDVVAVIASFPQWKKIVLPCSTRSDYELMP